MINITHEASIQYYPCMRFHQKPCIDCRALGVNMDSLRRLRVNRYVRVIFGRETGDDLPTIQQLCTLLKRSDSEYSYIHSDSLGLIEISPDLKKLANTINYMRRQAIEKLMEREELDLHCPIEENELG